MKSFRTLFPVLGVVAMLAGCSGGAGANTNVDSANAAMSKAESSDPQGRHHRGPRHGGPDFLIGAALHEPIQLTAEQKTTIEGLAAQTKPKAPPSPDKQRLAALAAGIRKGTIDAATIQAQGGDEDVARKERLTASANALATLHKTLNAQQRAALVDAITSRQAKAPPGEHGERTKRGDGRDGGEGHRGPHAGHGGGHGGPMFGLLEDLNLTKEQQESIRTKLAADKPTDADREGMKARFETMKKERDAKLQTFKGDAFDAASFVAPPADAQKGGPPSAPSSHGARMAKDLQVIVSVLDAAQREKLAQKIEQGPPARPERH